MRDVIIIMQKQRALITCKNNLFKPAFDQNNNFLSVKFKVQLKRSRNYLHQSVSESLSMKWNLRLRGLMTGEVLLLRLNVTVQLVKEFIRFCACELIMCGITALEVEGPDVLLGTGMRFAVLFPFEMAHESCRCSSSSASS